MRMLSVNTYKARHINYNIFKLLRVITISIKLGSFFFIYYKSF